MKIITLCSAGLVRSVALADVLKLHFEPADVLPAGIDRNTKETLYMLYAWADKIVAMTAEYARRIPAEYQAKVFICEVGSDVYGNPKHPELIEKAFRWARENQQALGVTEHNRVL